MKGLSKGLLGQHVGSRLLIAIPPADGFGAQGSTQASVGPSDTLVFLVDILSATTPLTTATGTEVPPKPGLPRVSVGTDKVARVQIPEDRAAGQPRRPAADHRLGRGRPERADHQGELHRGPVEGRQEVRRLRRTRRPVDFQIGTGKVIKGWDKGLVGQTVGSRMLLIVPPADGYGSKGSPPIGPKDTMVFVVDILAAS